jgi:hypothetical protein
MTADIVATPYNYTAQQSEVLRLHELYRRCLLDQMYWAWMLGRYKRWDRMTNIVTAISTSSAVAGMALWKNGMGEIVFTVLGSISALLLVVKPFFKPAENIERYSKLHYGFTALFYQIENLVAGIRREDGITDRHRTEAEEIVERFKNLALQEDAVTNEEKVEKFQDKVDRAIPKESLWLPR